MAEKISIEEKEFRRVQAQMRAVAGFAAITLFGGGTIYHFLMHLGWIDAFYFTTVTLTTVGYGDIVPKTPGQKLFTMLFILIGVGIIATFASLLVKSSGARRVYNKSKRTKSKH
jgi:voltage-gated potassium channel